MSQQGDGSTLVGVTSTGSLYDAAGYVLTERDGTVMKFDTSMFPSNGFTGFQDNVWPDLPIAAGVSIQAPNGDKTSLIYKTMSTGYINQVRLQSVTNSLGYQLKYQYAESPGGANLWGRFTSVTAINNAVDYFDPLADSCAA